MINIARILSECPKNTKLYSPIFGDVYLYSTSPNYTVISVTLNENGKSLEQFLSDGRYTQTGECMLFPSKKQRNWHKFHMPFKDGDIISNDKFVAIFYNFIDDHLFYHCWYNKQTGEFKAKIDFGIGYGYEYTYATEKEKTELFNIIKANGYEWNADTKTLEKLVEPKFKVGDRIKGKYTNNIYTISGITPTGYELTDGTSFNFDSEDCFELVPNKFDISSLKPYDKVLVRTDNFMPTWTIDFYDGYQPNVGGSFRPFGVLGGRYFQQCIPYEGNEHLRGTTNECDSFYKNW